MHPFQVLATQFNIGDIIHDSYILNLVEERYGIDRDVMKMLFSTEEVLMFTELYCYNCIPKSVLKIADILKKWDKSISFREHIFVSLIDMLLEYLQEFMTIINQNGNIKLLEKYPKTWLDIFKYLSRRGRSIIFETKTDNEILPQAKFPFSQHLYYHLLSFQKVTILTGKNSCLKFIFRIGILKVIFPFRISNEQYFPLI